MPCSPKPTEAKSLGRLAATAFLCLAFALALLPSGGCSRLRFGGSRTRSQPAHAEQPLQGLWFQLAKGVFEPVPGAESLEPQALQPWTVQARVSDLAAHDGRLYLAVNGFGLAALSPSPEDPPRISYFYDPLLFRYRTLTTIIPQEDYLLCHLYFNRLLNVAGEEQLKIRSLSLLKLFPQYGIYKVVPVPFQKDHPDWEAVGFVPQSPERFFMEWKYSSPEETRFQFSLFSLPDQSEQPADRQAYRQSFGFRPADERLPQHLRELTRQVMKRTAPGPAGSATAFHFLVRVAGEPLVQRYSRYPSGFDEASQVRLITIHGFQARDRWFMLAPEGMILSAGPARSGVKAAPLPALPSGFSYTDLYILGDDLVVTWEQSAFTQTGAAGIFISRIP